MIGYLRGRVVWKDEHSAILDVQGVGYRVLVADSALPQIAEGKENQELYCYLWQREDTLELYGFLAAENLKVFEILTSISGIGPKAALQLSSLGSIEDIKKAIESRDRGFFAGIKGIGKKKLDKILFELTGKLDTLLQKEDPKDEQVVSTLVSLGFSRREAKEAVQAVPEDVRDPEEQIKAALKQLGPRG